MLSFTARPFRAEMVETRSTASTKSLVDRRHVIVAGCRSSIREGAVDQLRGSTRPSKRNWILALDRAISTSPARSSTRRKLEHRLAGDDDARHAGSPARARDLGLGQPVAVGCNRAQALAAGARPRAGRCH